ncbi:hypothetical protein LBMAG27_00350 [Bacteroidota bacterium]|nr:hypothetical protein LBMAG27_00350 [Bacteroidota bacterium]
MKNVSKLVLLIAVMVYSNIANAQIPFKSDEMSRAYDFMQFKKDRLKSLDNTSRANFSMYIDYGVANGDDLGYVWSFNSNYQAIDTALNYIATTIDNIAGYTDGADPVGSTVDYVALGLFNAYPAGLSITIDSIFEFMTHENNSGNMDYFNTQLVLADGTGKPTTTVVWQATDSSNLSLSSNGNWLGTGSSFALAYAPAYSTVVGQKVSCVFNYDDQTKQDSLGFIGTGVDDGSGGTANPSAFTNSFMRYPPFIPNITHNSSVGYGNPVGSSGWYEAQNWSFTFLIHYDDAILWVSDVNENLSVNSIYPNPATSNANVHFFLENSSNLEVNLIDVTGKLIQSVYSGSMAKGHHDLKVNTNNIPSGIYMISMKADNGNPVVSKLVVSH